MWNFVEKTKHIHPLSSLISYDRQWMYMYIPLSYHNSAGLLSTVKIKVSLPTLTGQTENLIGKC